MVRATRRELRAVDVDEPAIVVADAGYWHQRQIEAVVSDGIEVLVPPDSGLRKGARPGWTGGFYDFMRRVLATPEGHAHYRRRQVTIEPVLGELKFNRQIRRFQREAGRRAEANGGSSQRHTTSSSFTATASAPRGFFRQPPRVALAAAVHSRLSGVPCRGCCLPIAPGAPWGSVTRR
jgi:hypothetical protein